MEGQIDPESCDRPIYMQRHRTAVLKLANAAIFVMTSVQQCGLQMSLRAACSMLGSPPGAGIQCSDLHLVGLPILALSLRPAAEMALTISQSSVIPACKQYHQQPHQQNLWLDQIWCLRSQQCVIETSLIEPSGWQLSVGALRQGQRLGGDAVNFS